MFQSHVITLLLGKKEVAFLCILADTDKRKDLT